MAELSEILDFEDFAGVKATLLQTGGDVEWKSELIEYINDETDTTSKEFFFDMMPCIRFINDPSSIAYTTPKKAICLSVPHNEVKTTFQNWYFLYLHECLHQMWDTFGAEDEIKKDLGSCDHFLLNVASDCIINEYLNTQREFRLPFPTEGLINAKYLKDKFKVEYNPRKDTQTSLYVALLDYADKIKQDLQGNTANPTNTPKIDKKSDDYVKGWNQAIEDWKSGKLKI